MRATAIILFVLALAASGCGGNSTTAPSSSSTTTTTTAAPTVSEFWNDVLPVGGFKIYSFGIATAGTVNITLTSVGGQFVPATTQLGIGIGSPAGSDCTTTQTITAGAATAAQISTTEPAGVFCARIYDVGNLFAPANFSVQIDHP